MKIAVTTASGGLGAAVIHALKNNTSADNIIGIARTPSKAKSLGIAIREGDYNKRETFNAALKGCEVLLIVSSNAPPENRIEQHRNIIEAAKNCGIKKLVYTSIIGNPEKTAFAPVIASNRQTEKDITTSGIPFTIGRNSLYIDPDLEYIDHYKKDGKISNCAGNGKCTYTSRSELGDVYAQILLNSEHKGKAYNLAGPAITQQELAKALNRAFDTKLVFEDMPVADYIEERQALLGEFLGTIIGGIYESIRNGAFNVPSDFEKAAKRKHATIDDMIESYKSRQIS